MVRHQKISSMYLWVERVVKIKPHTTKGQVFSEELYKILARSSTIHTLSRVNSIS